MQITALQNLNLKFPKKEEILINKNDTPLRTQLKSIKKTILRYGLPVVYITRNLILYDTITILDQLNYTLEMTCKEVDEIFYNRHGFKKIRKVPEFYIRIK